MKAAGYGLLGRAGAYAGIGGGEQFANDLINNLAGEQEGLSSPGNYFAAAGLGVLGGVGGEAVGAVTQRILGQGGSATAEVIADIPQQARGAARELTEGAMAGRGPAATHGREGALLRRRRRQHARLAGPRAAQPNRAAGLRRRRRGRRQQRECAARQPQRGRAAGAV